MSEADTMAAMVEVVVAIETKGWKKLHTSTASFRRQIRDKSIPKERRNKIYAWLLYRRYRGWQ